MRYGITGPETWISIASASKRGWSGRGDDQSGRSETTRNRPAPAAFSVSDQYCRELRPGARGGCEGASMGDPAGMVEGEKEFGERSPVICASRSASARRPPHAHRTERPEGLGMRLGPSTRSAFRALLCTSARLRQIARVMPRVGVTPPDSRAARGDGNSRCSRPSRYLSRRRKRLRPGGIKGVPEMSCARARRGTRARRGATPRGPVSARSDKMRALAPSPARMK